MKNILNGTDCLIQKGWIVPVLKPGMSIDAAVRKWNLSAASAIVSENAMSSSKSREDAVRQAQDQYYSVRPDCTPARSHSAEDGGVGSGHLLGVDFASVHPGSKDQSSVRIGLVFQDGQFLHLEVDPVEYARLQTAVKTAVVKRLCGHARVITSHADEALTLSEMSEVLEMRSRDELQLTSTVTVAAGVAMFLALAGLEASGASLAIQGGLLAAVKLAGVTAAVLGATAFFLRMTRESRLLSEAERALYEKAGTSERDCGVFTEGRELA